MLLAGVLLACGSVGAGPAAAEVVHSIEIGGGWARYLDGDEDANGEFLRLSRSVAAEYDLRLDLGRQQRFGATTWGIGASVKRFLDSGADVTLGLATSTGELAPELSASLSVGRPLLGLGARLGVAHSEWEEDARTDELFAGLERWFAHWIVGGSLHWYRNEPGPETTWGGGVGVTWYTWRRTYVGVGADFGNVRYRLTGTGGELVEYESRGYYAGISRWLDDRSGINVRLDYGDPPEVVGLTASWFREW